MVPESRQLSISVSVLFLLLLASVWACYAGTCAHRDTLSLRAVRMPTRVRASSESRGGFRVLEWAGKGGFLPQPLLVTTAKTGWREAWKLMVNELAPQSKDGEYVRPMYGFRESIGSEKYPATPGRYQIYTGNPCPWCHRVLLVKALRGIPNDVLPHTALIDDPTKASRGGWVFGESLEMRDPVFNSYDLRELYERCSPDYSGRCTAPLMIDKKTGTIISNESEDIIRMLNEVDFPGVNRSGLNVDLYPPSLRSDIDAMNKWIYSGVNNGVYRCGFATTQVGYDKAIRDVTESLDKLESILSKSRFLLGDKVTEADLRLLPTISRFDAIYHPFFKCTTRWVSSLPNVQGWLQDMYQIPGVKETLDLEQAKRSYYTNLFPLNPSGIVPEGPSVDVLRMLEPPNRGPLDAKDIFFDKAETRAT
eukprot:CAMPEP_0184490604 /NCGR_PEP_ID=MMETSP0113_2-20130426/18289_1 /TAXON_ID=91329 /ORGANISM="Norrisiella sphaerica, Strain BC52" /LENGTH=420 /DNA_ID=CAMNT_0026874555 /DNA_START=101 /DNA_END=1363 /DNA_ORIENTATION=-